MSPLSVPNFSPIRARIRVLWRILRSVRNEEDEDRVRNPKHQLLQIDPPTIVGCSLWYPIARSTMKPEARLLSSQKYRF